jgi:hypothetical protein
MNLFNPIRSGLTTTVLLAALEGTAFAADLGVDFNNDQPLLFSCQASVLGCSLGYQFQVTQQVTIEALGAFSHGNLPLNASSHQVSLWDAGSVLKATASVSGSSTAVASASGLGNWVFSPIAPVTLAPGSYVIASFYANIQSEGLMSAASVITAPGIVMGLPLQSFSSSLVLPTTQINTSRFGYFGPSFLLSPVPEPSMALMALVGGAFVLVVGRKRR